MNHYLAFTLGPIYNTLKQARKTRELWAASYIFSAMMRELLNELRLQKFLKENDENLLAPCVEKRTKNGAGIYPDRCFLEITEEITAIQVNSIISNTIDRVSNLLSIQPAGFKPADHFRMFAAQLATDNSDQSVILQLNNILDAVELQPLVPKGDVKLVAVLEANIQELYKDAGKNSVFITYDEGRQQRLPSLLELSTVELNVKTPVLVATDSTRSGVVEPEIIDPDEPIGTQYAKLLTNPTNKAILEFQRHQKRSKEDRKVAEKHEADAQENALRQLKNALGEVVKFRHKYVCFVKADGDSVGKIIGAIGNNEIGIQAFSKHLGSFAERAVAKIIAFGAIPVYAGGDDLLFVAPVKNETSQHIFELLSNIDQVFPDEELMVLGKAYGTNGIEVKPSLSFGLSISYYKYPMFESLEVMDELLFGDAKNFPGKNAIAFRVLKHSGQAFGTTLAKGGVAYKKFSNLLVQCGTQDTTFLTSVMHRLSELKPFLEEALRRGQTHHFFKHHFNESDHAPSAAQNYLKAVREMAEMAWEEEKVRAQQVEISPSIDTVLGQIYAALRFVQFLNQEDHD